MDAGILPALGRFGTPAGLDGVRVGEPRPGAVRIVIDVRAMTNYRVMKDGPSLIIIIGDEGVAAGSGGSR